MAPFQSASTRNPSNSLSQQQHSGVMTALIESPRRTATDATFGTLRRGRWRSTPVARTALAVTFLAVLFGTIYVSAESAHFVASLAAFVTAIALIIAAVVSWERVVVAAQSAGLVER